MNKKVTKAVIAVAGYSTRFLPAAKNLPKQMLPLVDKPIIHYLVEEAVNSGIKDIIIVGNNLNHTMEDYFDHNYELEETLKRTGKLEKLEICQKIPQMANFIYCRQTLDMPYGNGTPLIPAEHLIGPDEPFVYMFGDDITIAETPVTKQLIDIYEKYEPAAILAVQEVADSEVHKYATIKYKENPSIPYEMEKGMEKVSKAEAPSNMCQFGRFIFTQEILNQLHETALGKDNELWIIDIINNVAKNGHKVIAQPIEGEWMTTGDPLAFLKTTLKIAMQDEKISKELKEFITKEII